MDSAGHAASGGRLRERFGDRNPAPVFAVVGVALVGAGFALPAVETLLFAWGGTALFAALLLQFVTSEPTVSARVATDLAATLAANGRQFAGDGPPRYVPDGDAVSLAVGGSDAPLDPVGRRLLATVTSAPEADATPAGRLPVLVDALVADLELADRASARTTASGAEVTVYGSRVGTEDLFDHPVVSVVGVGLARAADRPVRVEATAEDGPLVVTCHWN